jgi:hypothetical protein
MKNKVLIAAVAIIGLASVAYASFRNYSLLMVPVRQLDRGM